MPPELTLAGITLIAATINGALGYGFSSITVPLALFFFTNRVLNPALVLLEVALNANVVLRWEWARGSTLFLIWQQNRRSATALGDVVRFGSLWDAVGAPGDNFIAVKMTYWIAAK